MTDRLIPPAIAGGGDEIIVLGAVSAHLAEGDAEALGTDPNRFAQDIRQIQFTEREAAKPGDGRLLAQQLLHFCGVSHRRIAHRAAVRPAISSHTGFPPNRPSRVRQPQPSARELSSGAEIQHCDPAKSSNPRTAERTSER